MHYSPGQPLTQIKAEDLNRFDLAADVVLGQRLPQPGDRPLSSSRQRELIRNDTGSDQDTFSVLAYEDPITTPTDNLTEFQYRPALSGIVPTALDNSITIIQQSLADGATAPCAVIDGLAVVQVDMIDEDDPYAEPVAGETGYLQSTQHGQARILYVEPGTGLKWAIVQLGHRRGELVMVETREVIAAGDTGKQYVRMRWDSVTGDYVPETPPSFAFGVGGTSVAVGGTVGTAPDPLDDLADATGRSTLGNTERAWAAPRNGRMELVSPLGGIIDAVVTAGGGIDADSSGNVELYFYGSASGVTKVAHYVWITPRDNLANGDKVKIQWNAAADRYEIVDHDCGA